MTDLEQSTGVSNPLVLLDRMTEKGVAPEALSKMMDLCERWQANRAREAFNVAMADCQSEIPPVIHDDENKQTGSTFAKLETVQTVVKPIYTRHGFSLSWSEGELQADGQLRRIIMTVRHKAGHSEQHIGHYPIDGEGPKGGRTMNHLQGTVSAHTYAQRDMMRQLFNLVLAGQDWDGQGSGLSDGQTEELNGLLESIHAKADAAKWTEDDWDHWKVAFWRYMACKGLNSLRASDFEKARDYLAKVNPKPLAERGKK